MSFILGPNNSSSLITNQYSLFDTQFTNLLINYFFHQLHLAISHQLHQLNVLQFVYQEDYNHDKYNNHRKTPLQKISNFCYIELNIDNNNYC